MKTRPKELLGLLALVLAVSLASQWWSGRHSRVVGEDIAALAAPGDIRMLSSDTCAICASARAFFTTHGVPFSECSIERDSACRAAFDATGSPGTPVLVVKGRADVGFNPERLRRLLQP